MHGQGTGIGQSCLVVLWIVMIRIIIITVVIIITIIKCRAYSGRLIAAGLFWPCSFSYLRRSLWLLPPPAATCPIPAPTAVCTPYSRSHHPGRKCSSSNSRSSRIQRGNKGRGQKSGIHHSVHMPVGGGMCSLPNEMPFLIITLFYDFSLSYLFYISSAYSLTTPPGPAATAISTNERSTLQRIFFVLFYFLLLNFSDRVLFVIVFALLCLPCLVSVSSSSLSMLFCYYFFFFVIVGVLSPI